jgi:hypothetical protein
MKKVAQHRTIEAGTVVHDQTNGTVRCFVLEWILVP